MKQFLTLLFISGTTLISQAFGQFQEKDVARYIATYKDIAIAEQITNNIPASIKLAQGIYETAAGTSELANNAKNHFGIKCKRNWQGESYSYDDDSKGECFRLYTSHAASYLDHSQFLKSNKRYAPLFALSVLDYKGWANQLKSSGYATNPAYAEKLIEIIERYQLNQYTELALYSNHQSDALIAAAGDQPLYASYASTPAVMPVTIKEIPVAASPVVDEPKKEYYRTLNLHGIKGFYAKKGDMLLEQAIKHKIRYATLLHYNDLKDEPLPFDMFIYLDNKKKKGNRPHVVVTKNQTLLSISQAEGIQLNELRSLNKLEMGEEPAVGAIVQLQTPANVRPPLRVLQLEDVTLNTNDNASDYIAKDEIKKAKPTNADDGVVKIIDDEVLVKTLDNEDELEEEEHLAEGIDPNDEVVEAEIITVIEKPEDAYTNFRVVENPTDKKAERTTSTQPKKGSNNIDNTTTGTTSEIEKLKNRMDRSVYSDGDALPVKRTDFEAGVAKVDNKNAETKYENKVPAANSELNRTTKKNVDNPKNKKKSVDLNIAFKDHMKLVKTGMYPAYFPKMTGQSHTSNTVAAPVATAAPKKAAPVKAKVEVNKNTKNDKNAKSAKTVNKNTKAAPNNTKTKKTAVTNKKAPVKPAANNKAKAAPKKKAAPAGKKKK